MGAEGQPAFDDGAQAKLYREVTAMKSTLLLATGLFLISAPAPDADDIAEMTANFIVPGHVAGTLASDEQIERGDVVIYPVRSGETMAAVHVAVPEPSGMDILPAG